MRFTRFLLPFVLSVFLPFAQHGALAHELHHWRDGLPAQLHSNDDEQKAAHVALCDFHLSLAQVLGATPAAEKLLLLLSAAAEPVSNHFPPAFPADLVVPASRGPPVLL